jgi:hypothetical protein
MSESKKKNIETTVEKWLKGADFISLACVVALAFLYQDYTSVRHKMHLAQSGKIILLLTTTFCNIFNNTY